MFAMSFNTSTNMGNNTPGSLNNGMVNSNVLMGIGGQSFHNSGNTCERPICKGPTWAMGRVCEHCKTNVSRWRHMPLITLGLGFLTYACSKPSSANWKDRKKGCVCSCNPDNRFLVPQTGLW